MCPHGAYATAQLLDEAHCTRRALGAFAQLLARELAAARMHPREAAQRVSQRLQLRQPGSRLRRLRITASPSQILDVPPRRPRALPRCARPPI